MEENYLFERSESKDLAAEMNDMFDEIDAPLQNHPDSESEKIAEESESDK